MSHRKSHKKCEICGLKSKNVDGKKRTFMARFPLDPDRCKSWVKITGNEDLAYIPLEKLHQLKFLCKNHFRDCHFNKSKNRLKRNAVPSINLRAEPLSDEILMEFPCYLFKGQQEQGSFHLNSGFDIKTDKRHYDHNYCKPTVSQYSTLLEDGKPLADNEDSRVELENHLDADDVTTPAPREFSWQRPPEVIPGADDVEIQTDVTLSAPDSAGGDSDDVRRPTESHNERLHSDCKCNECGSEIVGYRYTCVQCLAVDLCGACEAGGAHPAHYVLRLPRPEPACLAVDLCGACEAGGAHPAHYVLRLPRPEPAVSARPPLPSPPRPAPLPLARRRYRYTCVQCLAVDLCGACEAGGAHPAHYVLRLPRPEPAGTVKGVLETLRGLLDHLTLQALHEVKKEEIDEEDPLSIGFVPPEPASPDQHNHLEFEELMEDEESIEETTLPFVNKFPLTDFNLAHEDTFRHFPTDRAHIQSLACEHSPDIEDDVEDNSRVLRLREHKNLSEVIPILNNDSVMRCSVVRPCEEETKTSRGRFGVATSFGNVARLGARLTRPGACVTRPGACVTRPGASVTRPVACITRPGACMTRPGACVTRPGACVTRPGACVTRPGACARVSGAPARPPELVVQMRRLDNQMVYDALAAAKRHGTLVATVKHGQVIR